MAVVLVGGQSRHVGKTAVVAGLISALPGRQWTAVKITPDPHGGFQDAAPDQVILIDEEKNRAGAGDTSRFLRAGAHRALWVRIREGHWAKALPILMQHLKHAQNVILESNRALQLLRPDLSLMVLDYSVPDVKASARELLPGFDAIVLVESDTQAPSWLAAKPAAKPIFRVRPPQFVTAELVEFVRSRLG